MEAVEREIARKAEEMRQTYQAKAAARERKKLERQRQLEEEQALKQREEEERRMKEEEDEQLRLLEEAREQELQAIAEENDRQRAEELQERALADRQRKRLTKGKMVASNPESMRRKRRLSTDHDYEPELEEENLLEEDINLPGKKGTSKSKKKPGAEKPQEGEDPDAVALQIMGIGFTPTCYPDLDTAEKLGLRHDVEALISGCGLARYMSMAERTYPEEAAEFLATLRVAELRDSVALLHQMGGGYITFVVNSKEYTLSLREIQEYFGFSPGKPLQHDIEKSEINSLWELLTGDRVFDNGAKGSRIRSPTVAYVRKAIAETFFSRGKTGPCSASDMYVLTAGLKNVFGSNPATEVEIVGDKAEAGLAYILVKQLESYRGKIMGQLKRGTEIAPLSIGGPITAILKLARVEMDWDSEHQEPAFMNIEYLRTQRILLVPRDDPQFYYKFQHPSQPEGRIILPNAAVTSFADPLNVMFIPPEELLIDPDTVAYRKIPASAERGLALTSAQKKKGPLTLKDKLLGTLPCLGTTDELREELREELKAVLKTELREELKAEIREEYMAEITAREDRFMKRVKKKMKAYFEQMEKIFMKKPPQFTRHLPAPPPGGPTPTKRSLPHSTSQSPGGSGSSEPQTKIQRKNSPPKEGTPHTPRPNSSTPNATPPLSL